MEPKMTVDPILQRAAFDRLAATVAALVERKRATRSAGVKPALGPDFDHVALGYATFREFLKAAEREGCVRLIARPGMPDVDVVLPDAVVASTPDQQRIRPDLWKAFVDWRAGLIRVYDQVLDHAFTLPAVASPGEDRRWPVVRELLRTEPSRFQRIASIEPATVQMWMKDFAQAHEKEDVRAVLLAATQQVRPIAAFTSTARAFGCLPDWNAWRQRKTAQVIDDWAKKHELSLGEETGDHAVPEPLEREAPSLADASDYGSVVSSRRASIKAAVDRMSSDDLDKLWLPIYALDL